jgi:tetratricopeptide (TPR) repeat protein
MKYLRTAMVGLVVVGVAGLETATAAPLTSLFSKKSDLRTPKAATFVAFAAAQELEADNTELTASQRQNVLDCARANYQKALEADPNHLPAYIGLARVYTNMSHHDKALETYYRALQKSPKNTLLWFDVGLCYCRTQHWEQALRSFQNAVALDPENRSAIQGLGFCAARAGRLQDSLQTLSKVMPSAEAHYHVARMMHHMKRDDLCRQYLAEALKLNPELAGARSLQAELDQPVRPVAHIEFE